MKPATFRESLCDFPQKGANVASYRRMENMRQEVRVTLDVDANISTEDLNKIIRDKFKGMRKIKVVQIQEEAEIYGNN